MIHLSTLFRVSQAIARTIEINELLQVLSSHVLEYSGAEKCALLLLQDGEWELRALADSRGVQLTTLPLAYSQDVPSKLIQYAETHLKPIAIENLCTDLPVIGNYLKTHRPQSLLCLPLLNQETLLGILYLEHRSAQGLFTDDRLMVLDCLANQAAIALDHARLYQTVQRNESRLRAVYESNNDAIMLLSEKCFVDCNSATLAIFKCPAKSEFCGKHPSQISPEYQPNGRLSSEAATDHIVTALTRGYDRFEWQHCRWDGSEFIAEVQLCRMEIDDQAILQAIVRDISDRKAVEAAIRQKSAELEQALLQLQKTQLQLVQIEKMSVLGNLVAGVAHEINNPIGCIVGNVSVMQNYVIDLMETLDLYQANFPEPGLTIEQQLDAIDLDYLRQDVPDVMQAIKDSGDRIAAISQSLRTFSRTDGAEKQLFNVCDGLDSTVLILRHRLKANEQRPKIEVVTHYDQLPEINCFPGQLNQVFMNILANAIDAIDELSEGRSFQELAQSPHQITISTRAIESGIQITIADDGPGMPPEVQRRIFDYMFTTKEVGKGTGLGLAIAHQIVVETHGGTIDLQSQVGEGSTFTLTLPC